MVYEYPDEFIVPITYINTFDYNIEKREIRDENSGDMLEHFVDSDIISENYKEFYLENINKYLDIDDEYVKNETKKK